MSTARTLVKLLKSGVPIVIQQTCILAVSVIAVSQVGRELGREYLAGLSLGNLTYNLLGLLLIIAPMNALEEKASQAFGAGRKAEVGLHCQRAVVVAALLLAPAACVWLNAAPVLRAFGQPAAESDLAARFLRLMLPVLPIQTLFETAKRLLFAQGIMWPPVFAAVLAVVCHLLWVGPWVQACGFAGGPLSMLCAHGTMLLSLLLLMRVKPSHDPETWPGLQVRTILLRERKAMCTFITTSLASLVSLTEWLFWESICFRTGVLGPMPLAIHGVAYSTVPLLFMIPLGLSIALSNGVGNALGEGNVQSARRLALLTFPFAIVVALSYASPFYLFREHIIRLYTSDQEVIDGALSLWPWVCLSLFLFAVYGIALGLLRGLGLQRRSAACILLSLWCIGFPMMLCLTSTIDDIWRLVPPIYVILDVGLVGSSIACVSWKRLSDDVRERHSLAKDDGAAEAAAARSQDRQPPLHRQQDGQDAAQPPPPSTDEVVVVEMRASAIGYK